MHNYLHQYALILDKTAEALLEKETIETPELKELVKEYAAEGYKDNNMFKSLYLKR